MITFKSTKANIYEFQKWIDHMEIEQLKVHLEGLLKSSGFQIVNFCEHHFPQQGFTCVWLLAESHLAVHTFPEENKVYIQLSSCNAQKKEAFASNF